MTILFPDWNLYQYDDIKGALETLGHIVLSPQEKPRNSRQDPRYEAMLTDLIRNQHIGLILTLDFYPVIADICHRMEIPYAAWCTALPASSVYQKSIFHETNYIFCFDSGLQQTLIQSGVPRVFYLPLAATEDTAIQPLSSYTTDINFVGSLHAQSRSLRELSRLTPATLGYLDGLLQGQQLVYGYSFMQHLLTPAILKEFQEKLSLKLPAGSFETLEHLYAEKILSEVLTRNERVSFLQQWNALSAGENAAAAHCHLQTSIPESSGNLPDVENIGTLTCRQELLECYRHSRITLNITNRAITSGIPQKVFDAMACGSLVLSNYQEDMQRHFQDGTDYICYENIEELCAKAVYYINHEEERQRIVQNAKKKIPGEHTYAVRIKELLQQIEER